MEKPKTRARSRKKKNIIDFLDGSSPPSGSAPFLLSNKTLKSLSLITSTTKGSHSKKRKQSPDRRSGELIDFEEHLENQLRKHQNEDSMEKDKSTECNNSAEREESTENGESPGNSNQGWQDEVFVLF